MVMLLHHLVGKSVSECFANVEKSIGEAYKVLNPNGKIIIVESCVPPWFFKFESLIFKISSWIIEKAIKHPPTLQYTESQLLKMMKSSGFYKTSVRPISKGKFVLQYGIKFPSIVTPVQPTLFVGIK